MYSRRLAALLAFLCLFHATSAAFTNFRLDHLESKYHSLRSYGSSSKDVVLKEPVRADNVRKMSVGGGRDSRAPSQGSQPSLDDLVLQEFFRQHPFFGVSSVEADLRFVKEIKDTHIAGMRHLSYKQVYQGVDVFGVVLRAHFNGEDIISVNGDFIKDLENTVGTAEPTLSSADAEKIALRVTSGLYPGVPTVVNGVRVVVYRTNMTQGVEGRNYLVYECTVESVQEDKMDSERIVKEIVMVGAHDGHVVDRWDNVQSVMRRLAFRGVLAQTAQVFTEGQAIPANANQDLSQLLSASEATYNTFHYGFDVDSYDNRDSTMVGVVELVDNAGRICPINAFWDGRSTNYCKLKE